MWGGKWRRAARRQDNCEYDGYRGEDYRCSCDATYRAVRPAQSRRGAAGRGCVPAGADLPFKLCASPSVIPGDELGEGLHEIPVWPPLPGQELLNVSGTPCSLHPRPDLFCGEPARGRSEPQELGKLCRPLGHFDRVLAAGSEKDDDADYADPAEEEIRPDRMPAARSDRGYYVAEQADTYPGAPPARLAQCERHDRLPGRPRGPTAPSGDCAALCQLGPRPLARLHAFPATNIVVSNL